MKLSGEIKINKPAKEVWDIVNYPNILVKLWPQLRSITVNKGKNGSINTEVVYSYNGAFSIKQMTLTVLEVVQYEKKRIITSTSHITTDEFNYFISVDDSTILKVEGNVTFKGLTRFIPLKKFYYMLFLHVYLGKMKKIVESTDHIEKVDPFTTYINENAKANPYTILKDPAFIYILFVLFFISFLVGKMMFE